MLYYENMSHDYLNNLSIKDLEIELAHYYLILSNEPFDNSIIMDKILYIQKLIYNKKNN